MLIVCVCVCVQKPSVQVKPSAKDSQWYDVGIVKVTNMVVTHYYVPYDGNVVDVRAPNLNALLTHLSSFSTRETSQIC